MADGYTSTLVDQDDGLAPPAESTIDGNQISRKPNGDIEIKGPEVIKPRIPTTGDFDENLASTGMVIDETRLASRLVEFAEVDKRSREDWESREKKSLQMLGITDRLPDENQEVPGMSRMTHPMLMEAAVRFQANAIAEVFPATGPAKPKILGSKTAAKQAKADRIEEFLNYYLTEVDREYFADTDQMLMYLPMAGSAFRKGGQNWSTGMPELRYIKATNFIAPYAGTDLRSMPRYAHEFTMTGDDIDRSIKLGLFNDVVLSKSGNNNAQHALASDVSDGRVNEMHDEDRLYTIYEYHIDLELEGDEKVTAAHANPVRPYIVLVEKDDQKILMIRRNWREDDTECKKRIWFAHHKYLPGLGFYGFGLPHVIGSLGNAASGAVNATLDAAQMASFQGGFKSKEAKTAGDVRLQPGTWVDVDSSAEDLAKSFVTPPFHPPAPALFQVLELLVDSGQRFAGTADVAVGDANNNAPVGTTIALIEQTQKPQSAIHKRLHKSMSDEMKVLTELIHDFMPDTYIYTIGGDEKQLFKSDFDGSVDVVSVTDPNIYSDTQRIQQSQATMQLVTQNPDLFTPAKKAKVVLRMMQALKIPDIPDIEPEADTPKYLDPVTENGLILTGKGVRAYETQDHAAHIKIHQHGAATAAAAQMDPNTQQMILAGYGVHIRDHMAMAYRAQIMQAAGIPPPPLDEDGEPQALDPHTEAMITAEVVAHLPPPPPPPAPPAAGPSPAEQGQQKLQAQDQLNQQKLHQQQQQHEQQMQQQAAEHAQALALKKQELVEEQGRQEAAHREQLRRTAELTVAENKRKDATTAADVVRKGALAKQDRARKGLDHAHGHTEKAIGTHLTLRAQAAKAQQDIQAAKERHAEEMRQAREKHQSDMQAMRDNQAAEKKHTQEMNRQKVVTGKVGLQQKRQATRIAASKKPAKRKP